MSLRTSLLAVVEAARSITGPAAVDVRTNQLTIRTRTWSGTRPGDGTYTDSDLVLPAHYPVRYMAESQIAGEAGSYQTGLLIVDHITPSDGAGVGYTKEQLVPTITAGNVEVLYVITGPEGGEFALIECRAYRPFTYQLVLQRKLTTPDQ